MTISDKNKKLLTGFLWALSFIGAVIVGLFFRFYPLNIYPVYAAKNQAQFRVYSGIQKSIGEFIQKKAPQLSDSKKNVVLKEALKSYLAREKIKIDGMISKEAQKIFEENRALKNPPYLMEVDPYYYLSLTERLTEKNQTPRPIMGREYFNEMMLAPNGAWYPIDLHPYTGLLVYRIIALVIKNIPISVAVGYVPLFLSVLCAAVFLLICGQIFSLGPGCSFIGACYLLLTPVYLRRSLWGWFDTDSYNILFPLLILWGLFSFFKETESRKKITFLILSGLATTLYSLYWRGWLLVHALIFGALLLTLLVMGPLRKGEKNRYLKKITVFFILTPFIMTSFLWGPTGLIELLKEASDLTKSFFFSSFDLWPDAFLTVGELRHSTFPALVQSLGGPGALFLFFLGIFPILTNKLKRNETLGTCLLLTGLLAGLTMALGSSIERFALLAVAPLSLGVANGVNQVSSWCKKWKLFSPASVRNFCYAALIIYTLWQGDLTAKYEHPIYNSTWDKMMTFLRERTPEQSIVTSWWCPGHYITAMGKRRVTFDGATQNTPQIYWVANLFLESDEKKAVSVLRMLDLSGNKAVDFLTQNIQLKLSEAVEFLHHILSLKKADALVALRNRLDKKDAAAVLELTHGSHNPPPGYVFIYNDMVDQVMALEYTGKWSFAKAEAFKKQLDQKPETIDKKFLNRNSKEHVFLTWSMAEGPYAEDHEAHEEQRSGQSIHFTNSLTVNLDSMDANLTASKFGTGKPRYLYSMDNGRLEKKPIPGADLNISALLIKDTIKNSDGTEKVSYRSVLADERLIESLLFRLYYLEGQGLKFFSLFAKEENPSDRTKIYIYRVNWETN